MVNGTKTIDIQNYPHALSTLGEPVIMKLLCVLCVCVCTCLPGNNKHILYSTGPQFITMQ